MKTIQLDKKYRYRNGEPARILCIDAPGAEPVFSLTRTGAVHGHTADGIYYGKEVESHLDLIEVLPLEVVDNRVLLTDEVRKALMAAGFDLPEIPTPALGKRKFQVGDKVRVMKKFRSGKTLDWGDYMDICVGQEGVVEENQDHRNAVYVSFHGVPKIRAKWYFYASVLELVTPAKP